MPSIIKHLHFDGADISFRKKFRLFFDCRCRGAAPWVHQEAIHYCGFEFLELNRLLTSSIGGAIFIIGFLLSSILADYKEAGRIPADIRTAIEAIDGDLASFAVDDPDFNLGECRGNSYWNSISFAEVWTTPKTIGISARFGRGLLD